MRCLASLVFCAAVFAAGSAASAEDDRELVPLPEPMQAHMLANMRDHLQALDEMLAALAAGDADAAGRIAETRIGMSSLDDHGAAHMAPFMPKPMQDAGTSMHRAASRFALVVQDADVEQTYAAQRKVFGALQEIVAACNACHAAYKLR